MCKQMKKVRRKQAFISIHSHYELSKWVKNNFSLWLSLTWLYFYECSLNILDFHTEYVYV